MAIQRSLLHRALHRDNNVAQHGCACLLIDIILSIFAQREAKHIRGLRLIAVLFVQPRNLFIVHKGDTDLGRALKVLIFQHGMARTPDEDAQARRDFYSLLFIGDVHFMRHGAHIPFF